MVKSNKLAKNLLAFVVLHLLMYTTSQSNTVASFNRRSGYLKGLGIERFSIRDRSYENPIVSVDFEMQQILLVLAAEQCDKNIEIWRNTSNNTTEATHCLASFDSILCWPDTPINQTVYMPCPDYVDKFNIRNKAFKSCQPDPLNHDKPSWTKSNFTSCLKSSDESSMSSSLFIEKHLNTIMYIRISGYFVSMISLTLSIIILLRPKLRCPRNFIHVNLFITFAFRTILVILVDMIMYDDIADLFSEDSEPITHINLTYSNNYFACKTMVSIFRYSGSVYHVAIFAEALYLVLLLKYPYYNEKKGAEFCIVSAWIMPFIWILPWIFVKKYVDDVWCWQTESIWNLIIKIPHSLLLVANIVSAVFIIKVLYSKMRCKSLTKEKIIKYRRLAKSILILIPIFGLHFIVFAWLPYSSSVNINKILEIAAVYVETFFNAYQGLVVSITCCLIHREVRLECVILFYTILKKFRCLKSFKFMRGIDSEYLRRIRYSNCDNALTRSHMLNSGLRVDQPAHHRELNHLINETKFNFKKSHQLTESDDNVAKSAQFNEPECDGRVNQARSSLPSVSTIPNQIDYVDMKTLREIR